METKFSDFDKDEYKKIRRIILDFAKEETNNDSFSRYLKNDYYYDDISKLEYEINKGTISLSEFFKKYKDRIYNDSKFTQCCGLLDILLYRYDKSYQLGGDSTAIAESKYEYGYQDYSLGLAYIKQKFGSLDNFYNEVAKDYIQKYFKKDCYVEIIPDIDGITVVFTHEDNVKDSTEFNNKDYDIYDNIFVLVIGPTGERHDLLLDCFNSDDLEDYLDFENIKKNIELHQNIKKYNL